MNVIISGDFSPMNRVEELINREEHFSFGIDGIDRENTMFILNFETTIASQFNKTITKVGPCLKCSEKVATFLKSAGVTAVTLANNHTMDYGGEGLKNTINLLRESGINTVGAGANEQEAQETLYFTYRGETVAIINCCEHEFSYSENGTAGTNPLDPIRQHYAIKEAKTKADYVIVIVHGGHEFYNLPSIRMQDTYRFFIDTGADAVINHHQHCYSGYEYWNGKPIYYGLGNFCFDWPGRKQSFYKGYCVRLHLGSTVSSEEIPYTQCIDKPKLVVGEFDGFRDDLKRLNEIISNRDLLKSEVNKYYDSMEKSCEGVLTPFVSDYAKELVRRGWLPKMIAKNKKLLWKAYLDCESHHDVMLHYLKKGY